MAAATVLAPTLSPSSSKTILTPLIARIPSTANNAAAKDAFDPKKHLNFSPPSTIHTMAELGFPEDTGVSPVAVSEPFRLFTEEAILRMRQEVLSQQVLDNCRFSSNLSPMQLRGFAAKYAPFVYDAWKHPETLRIVSQIAGVELVTQMDFEIGHVNLSVQSQADSAAELRAFHVRHKGDADGDPDGGREAAPIVGWHTDSYPFVCVTMLSDCTNMVGGETAVRTGTGEILKVRGPQMGCAVILQGKYLEHQALAALGATERITMVTSFRPRNPCARDDSVLTTVRAISVLPELYGQFAEYRLEMLEERVRAQLKEIREARAAGRGVATARLKAFAAEQEAFLAHMRREMVDDEKVVSGLIEDDGVVRHKEANKGGEA